MAMMITVFRGMTSCRLMVVYRHFNGSCCLIFTYSDASLSGRKEPASDI